MVSHEAAADAQAAADVAKADLTQARSAVTVARANLEEAKAVLALEEARLAKYSLHAPFDGVVMTRYRGLGSALNANEAVFQLVDPATIWALAYIDEGRAVPLRSRLGSLGSTLGVRAALRIDAARALTG